MENVEQLLKGDLSADAVEELMRAAYEENGVRRWIREAASKEGDPKKAHVLKTLSLWFAPRHEEALKAASKEAKKGAGQRYLYARLLLASDRPRDALKLIKKDDKGLPFLMLAADAWLRLGEVETAKGLIDNCLLYTSPSPRD